MKTTEIKKKYVGFQQENSERANEQNASLHQIFDRPIETRLNSPLSLIVVMLVMYLSSESFVVNVTCVVI